MEKWFSISTVFSPSQMDWCVRCLWCVKRVGEHDIEGHEIQDDNNIWVAGGGNHGAYEVIFIKRWVTDER